MIHTRPSATAHRRAGNVLVMFAIGLIGMLAFAALVVDVGLVMLTRRQMQTAVNMAAMEGLRFRDDPDPNRGRNAAQMIVNLQFDDNLSPSTGGALNLGAGPMNPFSGGIPTESPVQADTFYASQTISISASPVYKPTLELNTSNNLSGDLVQGGYDANASHIESNTYSRLDFPVAGQDAFLARLRRTGEQVVNGIQAPGPPVPFLFGHFAIGAEGNDPAAINRRRARGTNVRATAIASARHVVEVGAALPSGMFTPANQGIEGLAPFFVSSAFWTSPPTPPMGPYMIGVSGRFEDAMTPAKYLQVAGATELTGAMTASSTTLTVASNDGFSTPPFIARIDLELLNVTGVAGTTWTVQRAVHGTSAVAHLSDAPVLRHTTCAVGLSAASITSLRVGYLDRVPETGLHSIAPVIEDINGTPRVIGFGRVSWSWNNVTNELSVTLSPGGISPRNSSARIRGTFFTAIPPDDITDIVRSNLNLTTPLLAPVLQRAIH